MKIQKVGAILERLNLQLFLVVFQLFSTYCCLLQFIGIPREKRVLQIKLLSLLFLQKILKSPSAAK